MKKIIMLLLISFIFLSQEKVLAKNLTMTYQDGVYYTRRGGNLEYSSNISSFYNIDSQVVYCIEPGVLVTNYSYLEESNTLPFEEKINKLIELIGYYGYEYSNHQTDKYRMATQALIWELVSNQIVEYFTERYGYGNYIDISYEKQQIMNLVNNHEILPSFANSSIDVYLNEEIVLEDENKVLNQFTIENQSDSISIVDNKLIIKPDNLEKEIILTKKKYDNISTIIYKDTLDKSQKVAQLRPSFDITCKLKLNIISGKLTLEKLDYENNLIKSNEVTLKDATYGIYQDNNLILALKTDENGRAYFKNLPLGNYYLKEIKPSYGYELDKTSYEFSITKDNLEASLTVYEKLIKKKIILLKVFEGFNLEKIGEENIIFDFYLKDKLYMSKKTNELGYLEVNLPFGTYLVKQRNTKLGYEKVKDFEIVIDDTSDDVIEKELVDERKKFKLKVLKVDLETFEQVKLAGIKFKIKDLETNEYLCYNNKCFFETNNQGEFITPFYLAGYYQIEEEEQVIKNYLWNDLKITFSNQDVVDDVLTIKFPNKRIKGSLKVIKTGEMIEGINFQEVVLEGVKFNLYAKENIYVLDKLKYKKDELIETLVTNSLGEIKVNNLELGSYYLKEIASSNNHLISDFKYEFELDNLKNDFNKTIEIKNYLKKASIELKKTDSITKKGLAGALIGLFKDNQLVSYKITNQDGKVFFSKLPLGDYQVKELKSPNGYLITDEVINVVLKDNEEKKIIEMTNDKEEIPNTYLSNLKIFNWLFLISFLVLIYSLKLFKKVKIVRK